LWIIYALGWWRYRDHKASQDIGGWGL
jgi:hypothetical protein